jgi:hypothetical protein
MTATIPTNVREVGVAIPDFHLSSEAQEAIKVIVKGTDGPRHDEFLASDSCAFAHYTSAETIKKVIEGRGVFMRNTRLMNDHSEVRHGFALVSEGLKSAGGKRYLDAWAEIDSDVVAAIPEYLSATAQSVIEQCYVLSVCEHREPQDGDGKLSMWRAYGNGDLRVAVIAKTTNAMMLADDGVFATPVLYGSQEAVEKELSFKGQTIFDNKAAFSDLPTGMKFQLALGFLINFAVSIKHPGFAEEQEWRYIYMSTFPTPTMESRRLAQVMDGTPQIVYRMPISVPIDGGYIPEGQFFKGVILGPCAEAQTISNGLRELLKSFGLVEPDIFVRMSSIPYRQRM